MTDLDTQVAEAQGWTARMMESGGWRWYDRYGKLAMGKSMYRPSTDLNQAVAFAEWAIMQERGYREIKISTDNHISLKWEVHIEDKEDNEIGNGWSHNLAEALCRAVLKALGETSI